jgi:hypothetical protein
MAIENNIHESTNFDGFYIQNISEPSSQYNLFEIDLKESQSVQLKIFSELEKGLPFSSGKAFSSQVHFQNSYQIPVQRWYPYREGYSVRLVKAFLNEFNISGNVFDPFLGSGTTLLAARWNNL